MEFTVIKRAATVGMTLLGLAACTPAPIEYIPTDERTLLQAQARLGASDAPGQSISVQEMLERARAQQVNAIQGQGPGQTAGRPASPSRLVVQFTGSAVALDETQRKSLDAFAAAAANAPLVVTGQKGSFETSSTLLGQRRAVSVAKALEANSPNVDVHFIAGLPEDVVVVTTARTKPEELQP